jgi:aspartate/methionine/tyrosine aminotransferase
MFSNESVNLHTLSKRAFNLRWAAVPQGTIPLTAADPDFPCAEPIREAVVKYARDGYFSYGPAEGLHSFRSSLANNYLATRKVHYHTDHVLPVDSAAFGIYLTCKTYLSAGDEAIIFDPVDFLFRYSVETVGATAVAFPTPQYLDTIDFSSLEQYISPKTKMICLCNPLNPTGKVFTKEELKSLGEIAIKHDLVILSDEIWSDIIFAPHVFTSIASIDEEIKKRTITITGFSKSYGLAALRVGAVFCPDASSYSKIFAACMHASTVHGCNVTGQIAATAALDECSDWLAAFVTHLQKMRDLCVDGLNDIKGISCLAPQGCYVAFADITGTGKTSSEIHQLLMNEAKVAVVPGLKQWFGNGAEGYIRLSFATSSAILLEGISRIKNSLN